MRSKKVKKKTAGKKTSRRDRKAIPKYRMPRDKRIFRLDAEIGRFLMDSLDAMTKAEIIRHFGISERRFNARARNIAPILKKFEKQQVMELLFEMGKERPEGKKQ